MSTVSNHTTDTSNDYLFDSFGRYRPERFTLAPARFGRSGTKVHLASVANGRLTTTVPACGVYTRPGSGAVVPSSTEVTCQKCRNAAGL
jgi:hypothetical protein